MRSVQEQNISHQAHVKYAAIYVRVSTEDQGKGFSIPTQLEACQKLAEREGYAVPETHVLIDEGISGTTMDRQGLRKLRDLVNTKAIAAAIVYDPDRLSRNLGHQLLLAEEFDKSGVKLLIVSHPMEQGPEGWLFFQMRGALAEYERAKILERTRRGTVGRIRAGHPWGGRVPLGYRYISEPHGGRFEIDDVEAALVRRLYSLCLAGMSTRAIARQLTAEGVPTPLEWKGIKGDWRRFPAGTWQPTSIREILTNRGYTGEASWGKRENLPHSKRRQLRPESDRIALRIPAIIDREMFDAVQEALTRHKAIASRNRKHEYLLSGGRLRCGRCRLGMAGVCRTPVRRYYICNSHRVVLRREDRCAGSARADELEAEVWTAVERVLRDPGLIAAEVAKQQQTADEKRAGIDYEIETIDAALAKCDREAQRWADAYAAEVINLAELKAYRADIDSRRQSLLAERTACDRQREAIGLAAAQVHSLMDYCAWVCQRLERFNDAEKRQALDALNITVRWTPGKPLVIEGSIPIEIVHSTSGETLRGRGRKAVGSIARGDRHSAS
jgi:site-specific DNA recombinase